MELRFLLLRCGARRGAFGEKRKKKSFLLISPPFFVKVNVSIAPLPSCFPFSLIRAAITFSRSKSIIGRIILLSLIMIGKIVGGGGGETGFRKDKTMPIMPAISKTIPPIVKAIFFGE